MPLAIYAASLESAVAFWDTGEAQTVPWIFGIMHPTGFPAFTIMAGVFAHVFALGTVAWRIAFFCALAASGSSWLVYRIARDLGGNSFAALGAAWMFAFGDVVWTRSTRPEIHDLALFFMLACIAGVIAWYRAGPRWSLPVAAAAYGLGLATHAIAIFITPSIAVLLAARGKALHRGEVLTALGVLALSLCTYAYLPIRSFTVDAAHLDPLVALGKPRGNAFWNTDDPSTLSGFARLVSGSDFPTGNALRNMISPEDYGKNGPQLWEALFKDFTLAGLALALAGIAALYQRDKIALAALVLMGFLPSAFAFGYTVLADMDRYFFASLAITAILCGIGAARLCALPVRYARFIALLPVYPCDRAPIFRPPHVLAARRPRRRVRHQFGRPAYA